MRPAHRRGAEVDEDHVCYFDVQRLNTYAHAYLMKSGKMFSQLRDKCALFSGTQYTNIETLLPDVSEGIVLASFVMVTTWIILKATIPTWPSSMLGKGPLSLLAIISLRNLKTDLDWCM
ncbi:hypothetical protein K435DRAFT_867516 [Dendrothele bispora CBS 962.96]|uniref:Uncharacterized protein n=1 Tax=Dendrothele bispora (strain CBS 962.96) TaxID=1314807 RepID=A0A4V4HDG9_DENBC|nr:hypothetical protein K435DRAFT_867516 [Dendrothele bispora CBS 962.96]